MNQQIVDPQVSQQNNGCSNKKHQGTITHQEKRQYTRTPIKTQKICLQHNLILTVP